jgi:predicted CXXCH cytochrome family protein
MRSAILGPRVLVGVLVALLAAACTDETIVYRDREPFNPPADAASGFLGYYTVATRQTTCGNCHATFQAAWRETRHGNAYRTLQQSPASQPACYSCHTVNARGNVATGVAGWDRIQDSTYRDVQCESCHGAGYEHVRGVNQGQLIRPLARVGLADSAASCAACHQRAHHPLTDEWTRSGHAKVQATPAGRAECASCHEVKAVLAAWGVQSNYHEKAQTTFLPSATCATCHNPHGSTHDADLRFSITSTDPSQNLCMRCHLRGTTPTTGSVRGNTPHAPQGAVLLGQNVGYRAPGFFIYDTAQVFTSHASDRNPKLCAGCHVNEFDVTDPAGGNLVFRATGHLFKAIPCVDAQGKPTEDQNCAYTTQARNWSSCTGSGCHANAGSALAAFQTARGDINLLVRTLWNDLNGNHTIDAAPTDGGYLAIIRRDFPGDLNPADQVITAADGAEFNVRVCRESALTYQEDGSKGTHNVFLCKALLRGNIDELRARYPTLPAPSAPVQRLLAEPLLGAPRISMTPD